MSRKRKRKKDYHNDAQSQVGLGPLDKETLLFSVNITKPKTIEQASYKNCLQTHTLTFCDGPAGTGKTRLAAAHAVEGLYNGDYKKIIVCRPTVTAHEDIGFLPGCAEEKLNPYMSPLYDEMNACLRGVTYTNLMEHGRVEVVPIGFMRGRNFHQCCIIIDEAQNCTWPQLVLAITRVGKGSTIIVNGCSSQCDLPEGKSGFIPLINKLEGAPLIGVARLTSNSVIRSELVSIIEQRLKD